MRFGWVVLVAVALGGCLSGQTGSPDCVGPVSCICDPLYGAGTLMRVHVEVVESGRLEAVVDEVFLTVYGATSPVVAGDRVGGALSATLPCAGDGYPSVDVGSELFVLYSPGYEQGASRLLDGVFSWAVPWADTLSFGDSVELASSEVAVLSTPESCQERFPPKPAPPCHDTQTGVACSAAVGPKDGAGNAAWLLGLSLVFASFRRRGRRGARTPLTAWWR